MIPRGKRGTQFVRRACANSKRERDPEQCEAVFRKDHAQSRIESAMAMRPKAIEAQKGHALSGQRATIPRVPLCASPRNSALYPAAFAAGSNPVTWRRETSDRPGEAAQLPSAPGLNVRRTHSPKRPREAPDVTLDYQLTPSPHR